MVRGRVYGGNWPTLFFLNGVFVVDASYRALKRIHGWLEKNYF
jgi:hypothetical protein